MSSRTRPNPFLYIYILWALVFIVAPLVLLLANSITNPTDGSGGLTLEHFLRVFEPLYLGVLWRSLWIALVSTVICILLGYPLAYLLTKFGGGKGAILIVLIIVPMWMNFLARTYAWMTLLDGAGPISMFLQSLGFAPLRVMYTEAAVILGMVYNFLPFMVLPIYSVLVKIDPATIEAAEDLGAKPLTVFSKVILPLSLPGIATGVTMVFLPAVSTFVVSKLLGGGQVNLIGNIIETQFLTSSNWGFGSALSVVIMVLILISMGILQRFEDDEGRALY